MREIVFDIETTGLNCNDDRIIEVGAVELINGFPSGKSFHRRVNPDGCKISSDATAVHGITNEDLKDEPVFAKIVDDLLNFFSRTKLIAHNAAFDVGFINAALRRLNLSPLNDDMIIDTLAIARRKHPMGPNSLDALCKRYGIDNSQREVHGALLDAKLLADVYIELTGGKQASLRLEKFSQRTASNMNGEKTDLELPVRPSSLPSRLSDEEIRQHDALIERLGGKSLWIGRL